MPNAKNAKLNHLKEAKRCLNAHLSAIRERKMTPQASPNKQASFAFHLIYLSIFFSTFAPWSPLLFSIFGQQVLPSVTQLVEKKKLVGARMELLHPVIRCSPLSSTVWILLWTRPKAEFTALHHFRLQMSRFSASHAIIKVVLSPKQNG